MRALACALILATALTSTSNAQTARDGLQVMHTEALDLRNIALPSDHYGRCRGASGISHERSIVSCGRAITERHSLTATATAYYHRGGHYQELGDEEHAREDFARAIEIYGRVMRAERRSAQAVYNRGIAYARTDQFDQALTDYAAAAALSPEWDTPHRVSGYAHFRRGDFAAALTAFDAATALDSEDSNSQAGRCEALAASGALELAEAACAEAIRLDRDNAYAHTANGYLKYQQGRHEEAYESFDRALNIDSESALAAYGRGMSAVQIGRQAEGEADIARARGQSVRAVSLYANAGMAFPSR